MPRTDIESLIRRCLSSSPSVDCLAEIANYLRPTLSSDRQSLDARLDRLSDLLEKHQPFRHAVRTHLLAIFLSSKHASLYVESGVLPDSGFFSELWRRISHSLLPELAQPDSLKDILARIFPYRDDHAWLALIGAAQRRRLLASLRFDESPGLAEALRHGRLELLNSIHILSFRITAAGLDPELLRNEPSLEKFESPFLAQNLETHAYLDDYRQWLANSQHPAQDEKQILVLLDQCKQLLQRIRRNAMSNGTSIALTYKLRHLTQHIERMERLLLLLTPTSATAPPFDFFCELVRGENLQNDLGSHLREGLEIMSLRITENASHAGENYIAESRVEYFQMLRSSLLGGCIIACMALSKLLLSGLQLPPLSEAILFSLNYALGFMLIHVLHGTVATKQPAMTAAVIAASIDETSSNSRDLTKLTTLIAHTIRTQLVAIAGNVCAAIPVALLFGWAIHHMTGIPFPAPQKAHELLDSVSRWGPAAFYAALTGICLFLSGLVAGYHDNLAAYSRIPQRLRQHRRLNRLLGTARLDRLASYIEDNLGALAGNFYFGLMLGGISALGILFGLPLDIRHIAFSSAYLGFGLQSLGFAIGWKPLLYLAIGIALIGLLNLAVSFTLALVVALKARHVTSEQRNQLIRNIGWHLHNNLRDFLRPPR